MSKKSYTELIEENRELQKQINELTEQIKGMENAKPQTSFSNQIPKNSFVISKDDPYFDGVVAFYNNTGGKTDSVSTGLVLSPEDPKSIPTLENYLKRCSDDKRREEIKQTIEKFKK